MRIEYVPGAGRSRFNIGHIRIDTAKPGRRGLRPNFL